MKYLGNYACKNLHASSFEVSEECYSQLVREAESSETDENAIYPCFYKEKPELISGILEAIIKIAGGESGEYAGAMGGYGITQEGDIIVDYCDSADLESCENASHILLKMGHENVEACCINEFGVTEPYSYQRKGVKEVLDKSPSPMVALMLAAIIKNSDKGMGMVEAAIARHYYDLLVGQESGDRDKFVKALYNLNSDLFCIASRNAEELEAQNGKEIFTANMQNILPLTWQDVKVKEFDGKSKFFNGGDTTTIETALLKKESQKVADLIASGEYDLETNWDDQTRSLVPRGLDNIVLSDNAFRSLNAIKATWHTEMPFKNLCWYGPSGTGKSTDARALAQVLGFPYYPQALSEASYADDILACKTANTTQLSKKEFLESMAKYPSVSQAVEDVESAWEILTGKAKPGVTIKEYEEEYNSKIYSLMEDIKPFKEIESPLFMAFTRGGVCELIEANAMKPSQMKVLNSMLDDTAQIYVDGKIYHRHPNFILIATMNCDEGTEGVHALSKDFVQRFQIGEYFSAITDKQIKQRIMAKTLLKDADIIIKMIKVFHSMQRVCIEQGDSHDFVGLRQLYNWAHMAALSNKPYESALNTMIHLGTFDEEFSELLIEALKTQFSEEDDK